MEINILAVLAATVAMFAIGAFWYTVPFANAWGIMHGFDKLSEAEQKDMALKMGPYYGAQALVTLASAWVLAIFMSELPGVTWLQLAFWVWLGFTLPANVSAVIFGGTEGKYIAGKIAIMAGGSLACLLAGAWVIQLF